MQQPMDKWIEQLSSLNDPGKLTDKQLKIVQAAIDTFAEKGYAGSSTSEIAQKAGVAEGTIFRHFKTKKELLLAIVVPIMVNVMGPFLLKEFAKIIQAPYDSIDDFLRAIIRNRLEFARNNLPVVKILVQEIPFHDDLRRTFMDIVSNHVLNHFVKVIEHYQQRGVIMAAPPSTILRCIVSNVVGLVVSLLLVGEELGWNEEAEIERTVRMIKGGIGNC